MDTGKFDLVSLKPLLLQEEARSFQQSSHPDLAFGSHG